MADKKEKELKKYLEKKQKQKTRDDLMDQIANLSKTNTSKSSKILKKKIKKKISEKQQFEDLIMSDGKESLSEHLIIEKEPLIDYQNDINTQVNIPMIIDSSILNENLLLEDTQKRDDIKEMIISLNESFGINRCSDRVQSIQEQRMKLEIFYEETEIISTIKYSLITFIQGNTGCGKTTQIPQLLFEHGFSNDGMIGVTQPRRFSAISIASRINQEMNENKCGYKIKYENNLTPDTKIKVMTEGVLFKEIQSDFLLKNYKVIVLDEVHERSVYSDVLVGLLSKIVNIRVKQRNPLRLILMSATLDISCYKHILGEFSTIFLKNKPHEVSIFYEDQTVENYVEGAYNKILAILKAEKSVKTNKKSLCNSVKMPLTISNDSSASILVFLASKEDIYSLKEKLESSSSSSQIIVLPLFSSLNKYEQSKVYEKYTQRKIILATNIAETSITIDDIIFVIDCGRVKRKLSDHNTVLYKIDLISKSSARQRAGRCGRTAPGVCYRIYSGDTFENLPDHNPPQILIEPFDSIFLQLKFMGIGNIFGFPFINQPSEQIIKDSIHSLQSLRALDNQGNITALGKRICQYPLNPRLARLLVSATSEDDVIFSKIAVITSILACGIEIKRNQNTEIYYDRARSDMLVGLKIFLSYVSSSNKRKFSSDVGISLDSFEEIRKLTQYLMNITEKGNFNCALKDLSSSDDAISKLLFYSFADHLAINCGSQYFYEEQEIFISSDSIKTEGCKVIVFDHIVCGQKRSWAKGITLTHLSLSKY